MTAVVSAQQYADGGKIALTYTDGTVEIGSGSGKLLAKDFENLISAVRHVQDQRPSTVETVPEDLGPLTMDEAMCDNCDSTGVSSCVAVGIESALCQACRGVKNDPNPEVQS